MAVLLRTREIQPLVGVVRERARELGRPCVVALDGRSGAGKSTLATRLAELLDAVVVDGDGFFAGGVDVRSDTPQDRARDCIDWQRQRPVLEALRAGRSASYAAFDWQAFDGRLEGEPTHLEPRPIVILDGVYAARPELRDLIDLRVLVRVSDDTRLARLHAREGGVGPWERQWHEAEAWYLAHEAPPDSFDLIVDE
jgi:uridine kinase